MRRAVALIVLAAALSPGAALARPAPAAADQLVERAFEVTGTPEPDGKRVVLDTTLMTTDPGTPRPAVVLAHGFGGTKADTAATARTLAQDGYAVVTYTARGFGASGGLIHLDNPAYEGEDARRIIDFASSRAEVAKDGEDPVIGFAGASYGGALALLVAGLDARVDAIVPAFTWHSLTQSLFPQYRVTGGALSPADVTPDAAAGVFKQRWASLLFGNGGQAANSPPTGRPGEGDRSAALCGRFAAELCAGYLDAAETGRPSKALLSLLDKSDLADVAPAIGAATLLIQGEQDSLFPLDQADANLRALPADTVAAMKWVEGGHDAQVSVEPLTNDLLAWFGRYLKRDGSSPGAGFSVVLAPTSLVGQRSTGRTETRQAGTYPSASAGLDRLLLSLSGGAQTIVSPAGGSPAALTNLPGTGGVLSQSSTVAGYALGVLPEQSATFTTAPLDRPLTLIGSGRVDLEVSADSPTAVLFVSLWDLGPDIERTDNGRTTTSPSSAVLPQLTVAPVRVTGLEPQTPTPITVALPAVAHQIPVGHRLQVVVATTDQAFANPNKPAAYQLALSGDQALTLPQFSTTPLNANALDVPLPLAIVVGLLAAAAVGVLAVRSRRRDVAVPDSDLDEAPLVVHRLVKTYREGVRAVDDVSFRAEAGQVVGLLGPNGAGKTTAIRMIVGLIRPDSGTIAVNGEPVRPGADVLGSVGALIEGPGFLPHLSGLRNLTAYWEATGRPMEEAHLQEALDIAGLGTAIHRRVRGYSQGMRQRLGIAQAMLGLPALLLLDEPTNGLDPPQIKAMRRVLAEYAASGRTVVVSSHLLAEVEQTCTHVVVMNAGKVVLSGAVDDLTASDTVTLIGLGDRNRVEPALRALRASGVHAEPEDGMLRVSSELPRSAIVAQLVLDGYPVDSVDGHRQLEEVFMSLLGSPADRLEGTAAEEGDVG